MVKQMEKVNAMIEVSSSVEVAEASYYEQRYPNIPEHLSVLAGGQWALWRNVVVRGAGFPISHVLKLAFPSSISAADQLLQAESKWHLVCNMMLRRLQLQQRNTTDKDAAHILARTIKTVRTMQRTQEMPTLQSMPGLILPEQEEVLLAYENLQNMRAAFMTSYHEALHDTSRVIHEVANDDRFREAIIWQNRAALHASIAALLRHGTEARGSEQRRREALVANYLQRYCTKNESIGFFGPLGWAGLSSEGETLTITPGTSLLEKRGVYFEGWAIDVLAKAIAKDTALLPYCAPRLLPHIVLDGFWLSMPFANPIKLNSRQAAILALCDGVRTARDIARCLLQKPANGITTEAEVYSVLGQLRDAKRIAWTLEVPAEGDPRSHPEQRLRRVLERIEDANLRQEKQRMLEDLVQARDAVAHAAGNVPLLDQAFDTLEKKFIDLTSEEATRAAGRMYAGRTLVYEDCRRDATISLGPDFVRNVERPLGLLLQSARWFTYEAAQRYREAFLQAFEELADESGAARINFAHFWLWAQPLLFDDTAPRPIDDVISEFQERWMDVLLLQPVQRHIHYSSEELLPEIQEAFAAPGPGWKDACYHSPDILLRAVDQEAIRQGQYHYVFGELHIAMNTQQHLAFLEQHPRPEDLIQFAVSDLPEPRIVPIFSKKNYQMTRMRPGLIAQKDIRLLYSADVVGHPDANVLPISALEVERQGENLVVSTKDGKWHFDIIDMFAEFLSRLVYKEFNLFAHHRYTPRVIVDQMVLVRESWSFMPGEIAFADEKDPARRFLAARAWTQSHGIPRFVFVKAQSELKPCFIDFASPISVDAFARLVRSNKEVETNGWAIKVTEMLPEPDQSWLVDAEGQPYSSELRFVVVDMMKPS